MNNSTTIGNVRFTHFGHASFEIESVDKVIYIDPFVLPNAPKKADVIFMTHEHYDHCTNYDVLAKTGTVLVTTQACADKLNVSAQIVTSGSKGDANGVKYEAVYAYNPAKQFHPRGTGVGFVIEIGGLRIYHAGDTEYIPEMKNLKNIDVALLPIGGNYTMDVEQAVQAAKTIKPKVVVPMHYGKTGSLNLPADTNMFSEKLKGTDIKVVII